MRYFMTGNEANGEPGWIWQERQVQKNHQECTCDEHSDSSICLEHDFIIWCECAEPEELIELSEELYNELLGYLLDPEYPNLGSLAGMAHSTLVNDILDNPDKGWLNWKGGEIVKKRILSAEERRANDCKTCGGLGWTHKYKMCPTCKGKGTINGKEVK